MTFPLTKTVKPEEIVLFGLDQKESAKHGALPNQTVYHVYRKSTWGGWTVADPEPVLVVKTDTENGAWVRAHDLVRRGPLTPVGIGQAIHDGEPSSQGAAGRRLYTAIANYLNTKEDKDATS